jgi:RNA polymerase sigma-70 factor (ECF subfamily)
MCERQFKPTRWTTVLRAGKPGEGGHDTALARLCEDYRQPLYQFATVWLRQPEDAEDLTQSFFCHFIERNLPGAAGRERGRFRTFLLACFKNFLRDEWRRSRRARAIPAEAITSLVSAADTTQAIRPEPATPPATQTHLDWFWAESIRQRATDALAADYARRNKGPLFRHLSCLLAGRKPEKSYADLAVELGVSEAVIKMEVLRLRERFRERFRNEVAQTVADPKDVDAESRYLLSALFSGGHA